MITFMSFLRSGSFQYTMGTVAGTSQPSTSRIIDELTGVTLKFTKEFIKFPNSLQDWMGVKEDFYRVAKFPNIIGAIDGTHIAIKRPKENEVGFVNRKQYHSMNVQVICNNKHLFMDAVAKWPGATHDSFIWRHSTVRNHLINGQLSPGWLLGKC